MSRSRPCIPLCPCVTLDPESTLYVTSYPMTVAPDCPTLLRSLGNPGCYLQDAATVRASAASMQLECLAALARGDSNAVQARRARARAASAAISAPVRPSAAALVAAAPAALPPAAASAAPPRVLCLSDLHADAPLTAQQRARQPHAAACNKQPAAALGPAATSPPPSPPLPPPRTHMDLLRRISTTRFQRDVLLVAGASTVCCRMGPLQALGTDRASTCLRTRGKVVGRPKHAGGQKSTAAAAVIVCCLLGLVYRRGPSKLFRRHQADPY